jgi:hypothetical protein
MLRTCWLAGIASVLLLAETASAQFVTGPGFYSGRGGFVVGGSVSFGRGRSISLGGSLYGPLGYGGYGWGRTQITIYQTYSPPTVVIIAPSSDDDSGILGSGSRIRRPLGLDLDPREERDRRENRQPQDDAFRRRQPADREPAPPPEPPRPIPEPPPLPEPPLRERLRVPPAEVEPPPPPQPPPDPLVESARHIAQGKRAFEEGQYGRASHRFRQAIVAKPDEPAAYFLLAQALMALGQYRDAVQAIQTGVGLDPDWPAVGPRPIDLYGDSAADYAAHQHRLDATLGGHPQDPVLLFLDAYFLWFDGRQEEARLLFQRAAPLATDRNAIDRFLHARPGP